MWTFLLDSEEWDVHIIWYAHIIHCTLNEATLRRNHADILCALARDSVRAFSIACLHMLVDDWWRPWNFMFTNLQCGLVWWLYLIPCHYRGVGKLVSGCGLSLFWWYWFNFIEVELILRLNYHSTGIPLCFTLFRFILPCRSYKVSWFTDIILTYD